jgi:predicted RNA-binding Zn-ribbon protein involved in translation (DUF1610 family)
MKIELGTYPKCACGSELVPVYQRKKFKEPETHDEDKLAEEEVMIWRCSKCEKVVEFI